MLQNFRNCLELRQQLVVEIFFAMLHRFHRHRQSAFAIQRRNHFRHRHPAPFVKQLFRKFTIPFTERLFPRQVMQRHRIHYRAVTIKQIRPKFSFRYFQFHQRVCFSFCTSHLQAALSTVPNFEFLFIPPPPIALSTPVSVPIIPATPSRSGSLRSCAAVWPIPVRSAAAAALPGNSQPLPTSVPVHPQTKFRKTPAGRVLPTVPQSPSPVSALRKTLPQSMRRTLFLFPVPRRAAPAAAAAPALS